MNAVATVRPETQNKGLAQLLPGLDEKSRSILCYLWWRRHAEICELRKIADTADDSEVLRRLKEIINEHSLYIRGKPAVNFEQSKIDPLTGQKVLFSWWYLDDNDESLSTGNSALVDIFNESDNVTIIAQLPAPVELAAPDIQFKNGLLRIVFKKTAKNQATFQSL
jgi:hypothetical protein